jgi:hypothetical protein
MKNSRLRISGPVAVDVEGVVDADTYDRGVEFNGQNRAAEDKLLAVLTVMERPLAGLGRVCKNKLAERIAGVAERIGAVALKSETALASGDISGVIFIGSYFFGWVDMGSACRESDEREKGDRKGSSEPIHGRVSLCFASG